MSPLLKMFIKLMTIAAALSLCWSCAAPLEKSPSSKPAKPEIKKVEKKQAKPLKKKKRTKKRKVKKVIQPEAAKEMRVEVESIEEQPVEREAPLILGRMMFHYDYYPEVVVYFDTIRHLYFYRDKGGWAMSVALPTTFQENLGRSVRLKMPDDRPYIKHQEHMRTFPAETTRGW